MNQMPPSADQFVWLMERNLRHDSDDLHRIKAGTLVYWDGGHAESFTTDPWKARRWPTKEAAMLECPPEHYEQWGWRYVEHGFMMSPQPPSPSAEAIAKLLKSLEKGLHYAYRGSAENGSFRDDGSEYVPSVFLTMNQLRAAIATLLAAYDVQATRLAEQDAEIERLRADVTRTVETHFRLKTSKEAAEQELQKLKKESR